MVRYGLSDLSDGLQQNRHGTAERDDKRDDERLETRKLAGERRSFHHRQRLLDRHSSERVERRWLPDNLLRTGVQEKQRGLLDSGFEQHRGTRLFLKTM